jgi:hypothetical protein
MRTIEDGVTATWDELGEDERKTLLSLGHIRGGHFTPKSVYPLVAKGLLRIKECYDCSQVIITPAGRRMIAAGRRLAKQAVPQ